MAHRLPSGSWRVRWEENKKWKSKTFGTRWEAQKFEAEIRQGNFGLEKAKERMSFCEFAERWYQDYALTHSAKTTQIETRRVLNQYLLPALGEKQLGDLRRRNLIELQAKLTRKGGLRAKSINNITSQAHKILQDAVEWEVLAANPFSGFKQLSLPEQQFQYWTIAERDRFLGFCRSRNPRLHEIAVFAVHTGMRLGEIEGLYRDCVNFEARRITVRRNWNYKTQSLYEFSKSRKIRVIPINEAVYDVLQDRRLLAPEQPVFAYRILRFGWDHLKPMCELAGVTPIRFHDLRHTFASNLVEAGVPLFDVMKLMGHSDYKMTLRYSHLAPDHLAGSTDVLISGKRGPATKSATRGIEVM